MKRTIIFKDADRNKVTFEAEITTRNGYPEFTASGEYCGSCGQCFDSVKPANDEQTQLIQLWNDWHLNGMNAGTAKQAEITKGLDYDKSREALTAINRETGKESFFKYSGLNFEVEKWKKEIDILNRWKEGEKMPIVKTQHRPHTDEVEEDYYKRTLTEYTIKLEEAETFLQSTLLYDIHPKTGELYRYGSEWIVKDLPETFKDELNTLLDTIEELEEEQQEREVEEEDTDLFEDFNEPDTALALALMLDLCVNEIDEIEEENNNRWTVQGVDYVAGTDDEMDVLWDEDLDNYIDDCILPELSENYRMYFDDERWKSDARVDGRAHSLNRYDGGELEYTISETTYYAYRQ